MILLSLLIALKKVQSNEQDKLMAKLTLAELEEIILQHDINVLGGKPKLIDETLAMLRKHDTAEDMLSIIKSEELDYDSPLDSAEVNLIASLIPYYYSGDSTKRYEESNLLKRPEGGTWKEHYEHALALLLADEGKLVRPGDTYYGWEDYHNAPTSEIVAIISAESTKWTEFNGTFVSEVDWRMGVEGEAIYRDGTYRKLRVEGDLAELISRIV